MILKRSLAVLCLFALLLGLTSTAVAAGKQHEDPSAIEEDFSGLSLLLYYSDLLDMVQQGNLENIDKAIEKLDYVNTPSELQQTNSDLSSAGKELFQAISTLTSAWQEYSQSLGRLQTDEMQGLMEQMSGEVALIKTNIGSIKQSIGVIEKYLKIESLPASSTLKTVYGEVIGKISQLEMFVEDIDASLDEGKQIIEKLKPADLTLEVPSIDFFPGDKAGFSGLITLESAPLADREIEIRLDGKRYSTVRSDAAGLFRGTVTIPEVYKQSVSLRAVFLPAGADIGVYGGSSSPERNINIKYYRADLRVVTEEKAYPGKSLNINGELEYSAGAPQQPRKAVIYFDGLPEADFSFTDRFSEKIGLDPHVSTGKHTLSVSVEAEGRYAPVSSDAPLEVNLAVPVAELDTPGTVLVPGSLIISGTLRSETGPLQKAVISLKMRKSAVEIRTDDDGHFDTKMLLGLGTDLIGNQTVEVQVQPGEPWNAPLIISTKIFVINLPNCAVLLVVLAALSYYLPRLYKRRFKKPGVRDQKPAVFPVLEAVPDVRAGPGIKEHGDSTIFDFYRFAIRLVTAVTRAVLKPHQTLREFAEENSTALGKLSRYFSEFTRLIEKLLYSRHQATDEDLRESRDLYESMDKEVRHEDT
ncbi:MAG: DUF4129 domain-containing protein [Dehalococcoidales bacterium]|nr:DUF4129 domain-containing protein [Dehalococcoidales bacterium]